MYCAETEMQADPSRCCIATADGDSMQQHGYPLPVHEEAADTACMATVQPNSARLSVATAASVRQKVAVWQKYARGRAWCLRCGMKASSWDGWAKMHVNPFIAMHLYFLPMLCEVFVLRFYVLTSLPMHSSTLFYVMTLPYALHMIVGPAMCYAMFRVGPQVVFHRVYLLALLFVVLLSLPVAGVAYVGPLHIVPWNDRFHFLIVNSGSYLCVHLGAAAGGISGEHPSEPRTSIIQPIFRAVIQTIRLIDSLTDLSVIGELLTEVRF